jgi:SAM-dependent methyltransferase
MPLAEPFEQHAGRYEAWFERHAAAYVSELLALRPFVPLTGRGLEIGVGSGRFAAPLGVRVGIDPSPAMLAIARSRGIETVQGVAEDLPFADDSFDHAMVVTTLCFVDSPAAMLAQARRVLRPDGRLVIGFIDRDSPIGRGYETHRAENVFYREARFHSAGEVERLLCSAGFAITDWAQTLSRPLAETRDIEPVRHGRGAGAFVVVAVRNVKAPGGDH